MDPAGPRVDDTATASVIARPPLLFLGALVVGSRRQTTSGLEMVRHFRTMFRPIAKDVGKSRGLVASEVLMLTAALGVAAVPTAIFPHREVLFPAASSGSDGGSGGSSCTCSGAA